MEPKARKPNLKWKPWTQKLPKKGWVLAGKLALDTPKSGDPMTLMGYKTPNVTKTKIISFWHSLKPISVIYSST